MVAMSEALVHARITLLQAWLRMLLFSSVWPLTWCAEYKGPPETVKPLRVTVSSKDMGLAGWMSYSLHFGGQRHIISMKSKNFLESRQLPVFTYNDQGVLFEDRPFVQNDCYYLGFVDGDLESMAALTTCFGGFQGIFQINDTAYEIKPKSPSSTFEHLLYKIDSEKTQLRPMRCGLTDEEIAGQVRLQENGKSARMQSVYGSWWSHGLYIKLALVIDHEQYLYRKRNTSLVIRDVLNIMHGINHLLLSVDINVVLLGLTIWTNGNPIPVQDIYALLPAFCTWKGTNLNSQIPYDIAHLFVNYTFSNYFGIAYVGTVCNKTFGCGIDSIVEDDFLTIGHIVAHEIGHNLGMPHDGRLCTCGEEPCLMSATMDSSGKLSNCSYEVLWAHMIKKSCIHREPRPSDIFQVKVCGNGIVEEGEQCDCGTSENCRRNRCCMPSCILRSRAKCDTGLCCNHKCQIQPSGTLCRAQENECDLPEWCNGTSHECPEDLFVQDGTSCPGDGYCYEKRCNSHNEHCQRLFGQLAMKASDSCYKELNTRGDRFGNCGFIDNEYVRCEISDILCGRIQCDQVGTLPTLQNHYTVHWTHFNSVSCWSTDYHLGMKIADLGDIKDGTNCGPQHVCIARKCVNKPSWVSDCTRETCNMKGVCNNKQHCHCDVGWSPPNCQETGTGGSIDSGTPGNEVDEDEGVNKKDVSKKSNVIVWLLPIICVAVVLFVLFCLSGATKKSPTQPVTAAVTQPPEETVKPPDEVVEPPEETVKPPDEGDYP
ncbi:disintegrin and metalloproteinase domain-containing protein 24 [Mus caroli]|uniref:Disintegrin and metalloproteinase domain-containing protein 24 n=2 Tax=Mus caroli TaxID=10089 RepID=A0A6P5Q9D9_MUSCR|nr:disintegrin and metalloproteinase domain-containing protein 24 [Mus caroli]XP_021025683.1 disintegrin and metalloproteinase domain-containing protein 24 [Mus caroli]XP_029336154.1 disintegrin and metalloproteinase domain-containing protein 24 [Mus caroli]